MRTLLASVASLALMIGTAQAVLITGTTTTAKGGADPAALTVTNLLSTFSLNLNVGASTTVNALTVTPNFNNGTNTYNFTVTDTITFVLPGAGTSGDVGTGSFHVTGSHPVDTGGLVFADGPAGTNISLAGGYVVNVNLNDVSFVGDDSGEGETVTATFTLVSVAGGAGVPEPASMMVLSVGLFGLGVTRRRRS